jgi:hypothetical protein
MNIEEYCAEHKNWSQATFGPPTVFDVEKLVTHIGLELEEVRNHPSDVEEWVDIIILAIDGAWRTGHSPEAIQHALIKKQEKNKYRQWNVNPDSSEPNLHVRDERETNP